MPLLPLWARRRYAADAQAIPASRRFTREMLTKWDASDLADTAALVVSELMTNAVVHTGTHVGLALRLQDNQLRIEVEDRHPGRALPVTPEEAPDTAEHGRGLVIVAALAAAWGVDYHSTTKRVWVMFERDVADQPDSDRRTAARVAERLHHLAVVETSADGVVTAWNADATALFGWADVDVVGSSYLGLLDPKAGDRLPDLAADAERGSWQGTYALSSKDGASVRVFASHVAVEDDHLVVLLVPVDQRTLLEHPAPAPAGGRRAANPAWAPDGDDLVGRTVEEYLPVAVARARHDLSASAAYLLMAGAFTDEYELVAASGLPQQVVGLRVAAGAPGGPSSQDPRLPVLMDDLPVSDVGPLAGSGLRSLLVAPVLMEGAVRGALCVASERVGGFTEDHATELQRLADRLAVAVDRVRSRAAERERRQWLSFISESGELLAGTLDQDMTMAITGQIVVPRIAPWCAIHLLDERDRPALRQVWHENESLAESLRQHLDADAFALLDEEDPVVLGRPATTMSLIARGRRIGVLTIGRPRSELARSEYYLVVESIIRRAALAIDNARAHGELQDVGRTLQESLLPPSIPEIPGLDVGLVYEPAGGLTLAGGDFYDVFPVGSGRWWFAVGDVCGTGAEAAAVTGLARHTIKALARAGFSPAATLERLNTALLEDRDEARFLTLVCGALEQQHGRLLLSLVNAGHPLPFLRDRNGLVREIGTPQPLVGVLEKVGYAAEEHLLSRGDSLLCVTDGVLERRNGRQMLGEARVAQQLAEAGALPAQALAERVRRLVTDFSDAPQRDDMAILTLRVVGRPG